MKNDNFNLNRFQAESGQTLVIIVFVMIIALTLGVSISSRTIKSLRSVTRVQTNYRAEAVATAALERILLKSTQELEDYINFGNCTTDCTLEIINDDGIVETASIQLSYLGNSSEEFSTRAELDDSTEINLIGYPDGSSLQICWDYSGTSNYPSIVGLIINGSSGSYDADAFAYNSIGSTESNNFNTASGGSGYDNCVTLNTGTDPVAVRFKALYQDTDVAVIPSSGASLPSQGILIEATGVSLDSTKKVQVVRSNTTMPAMLDYVLFSKSYTQPLSN